MENYAMVCEYYDIDGELVEFLIKVDSWSELIDEVEFILDDFPQIMIANIYEINEKRQAIKTLDYHELKAVKGD